MPIEYKIEYERDDGRVAIIFIPADNEAEARETFVNDSGYSEDRILSCE